MTSPLKVVEEWTSTTENHVIEGLKTGEEYTLKETVARDGYTIPDDFTFNYHQHYNRKRCAISGEYQDTRCNQRR